MRRNSGKGTDASHASMAGGEALALTDFFYSHALCPMLKVFFDSLAHCMT